MGKKLQTESVSHPVEVWYRITYSQHYYPPIREMKVQRTDIKNEPVVRTNMNRLIKQGAYSGITLALGITACITVVAFAAYTRQADVKNILALTGFIAISYSCRVLSIKQKKVREDFWENRLSEEQLKSKTTWGRIMISVLFVAFVGLSTLAFYDIKF